jgi:hypothetical protein
VLGESWIRLKAPELYPHEILCPLTYPGFHFGALLNTWLELADRVPIAMMLLQSVLMKAGTFLETEIVEMLQALEAYCSETEPFEYLEGDDFESALAEIMGSVQSLSAEFRERVKGTAKYLNRPSQRSHLNRLLERLDAGLVGRIVGKEKPRSFVNRVVDARNKISHPQSGSVWADCDPSDAVEMISRLKLLLIVSLLGSAGMHLDLLQEKYGDHRRWQWG